MVTRTAAASFSEVGAQLQLGTIIKSSDTGQVRRTFRALHSGSSSYCLCSFSHKESMGFLCGLDIQTQVQPGAVGMAVALGSGASVDIPWTVTAGPESCSVRPPLGRLWALAGTDPSVMPLRLWNLTVTVLQAARAHSRILDRPGHSGAHDDLRHQHLRMPHQASAVRALCAPLGSGSSRKAGSGLTGLASNLRVAKVDFSVVPFEFLVCSFN